MRASSSRPPCHCLPVVVVVVLPGLNHHRSALCCLGFGKTCQDRHYTASSWCARALTVTWRRPVHYRESIFIRLHGASEMSLIYTLGVTERQDKCQQLVLQILGAFVSTDVVDSVIIPMMSSTCYVCKARIDDEQRTLLLEGFD